MANQRAERLTQLMLSKKLVRFEHAYESGHRMGYVLAAGPRFFLLWLITDEICSGGFECFRVADIRRVRPDPYAEFVTRALRLRGVTLLRSPKAILADIHTLLKSASKLSSLITIHREQINPDVCWIGKIQKLTQSEVHFLEIGPDATWGKGASIYKLNEITRVAWGGAYEEALSLVSDSMNEQF